MKKSHRIASLLTLSLTAAFAATVAADAVEVPVGQQGEQSVERPPRGVNKQQVEAVYGEPESKEGPTGEPPIYTWHYSEYTVYFESDQVIHTVLKGAQQD